MKHARAKTKESKGNGFRKFLLVWTVLLILCGAFVLYTVNKTLKEMQANSIEQFISDSLASMSDEKINECFEFNQNYDSGNAAENVREFFENKEYTIKQNKDTGAYNIYNADNQIVLSLDIENVEKVNKYLIFNYNILELKNIIPTESKELYHYEINAGSEYQVSVNGKPVEPVSKEVEEGFGDASDYVELPSKNKYVLDHLSAQPEISITRNGQNVDFDYSTKIEVGSEYQQFDSLAAAGCDFDAMEFAKTWSLFMSDDLTGTYHGFYTVANFLIEGSEQYNKAWQWATAVDIQFTWGHTFKTPPFTEESLSNATKYSDDAYSVDVHFVKHMVLTANGESLDDEMNSTIYIVRHNGQWKVVNIKAIAGE